MAMASNDVVHRHIWRFDTFFVGIGGKDFLLRIIRLIKFSRYYMVDNPLRPTRDKEENGRNRGANQ